MSADIIILPIVRVECEPGPPNAGNGALEVVRDYLERVHPARTMAKLFVDDFNGLDALPDADHFLAWMWEQGFKVVPVE